MRTFLLRIAGAAALHAQTYEEIESDERATPQALGVVVLASLAAGVGASGWSGDVRMTLPFSAVVGTAALLVWASWALLTFEIGSRLLPAPTTRADVGELLRTLGFSAAPGLFLVLGAFPGATTVVFSITALWMLGTMVVALRQALDYPNTARAIAVCAVAWILAGVFVLLIGLVFSPPLTGRVDAAGRIGPAPGEGSAPVPAVDGARLFMTYCASCHGRTGEGNGPVAGQLRKPPADLTKLAARNGGVFPSVRINRIIDGRDVPSHGDREMPVWGDVFRSMRDEAGNTDVAARIEALVKHLQEIQERAAE